VTVPTLVLFRSGAGTGCGDVRNARSDVRAWRGRPKSDHHESAVSVVQAEPEPLEKAARKGISGDTGSIQLAI
jgi:hypothetical protein